MSLTIKNVRKTGRGTLKGTTSLDELMKADLQMLCAWSGCKNSHKFGEMPDDWVNLLVWSGKPDAHRTVMDVCMDPLCYRDAVLCPDHAREFLNIQLKPIPARGQT